MMPADMRPSAALVGFVGIACALLLVWMIVLAIVRRIAPRAIPGVNTGMGLMLALVVNILVFYASMLMCSAGLKEYFGRQGMQSPNPVLSLFLWWGGGLARINPGSAGIPVYAILGGAVALFSLIVSHVLFTVGAQVVRWFTFERDIRELQEANAFRDAGLEDRAGEIAARICRTRSVTLVLGLLAVLFAYKWVVVDFDTLLIQTQTLKMSRLYEQTEQGFAVPAPQQPSPQQLLRDRGETVGALVVGAIKYFYIAILLLAAYLWHNAYANWQALQHAADEPIEEDVPPDGREATRPPMPAPANGDEDYLPPL